LEILSFLEIKITIVRVFVKKIFFFSPLFLRNSGIAEKTSLLAKQIEAVYFFSAGTCYIRHPTKQTAGKRRMDFCIFNSPRPFPVFFTAETFLILNF
jgi:hypothetical protein